MIYDDLWKSHLILFLHWYLQDKIDQNIKHILMRTSFNDKVSVSATHKQSRLHMITCQPHDISNSLSFRVHLWIDMQNTSLHHPAWSCQPPFHAPAGFFGGSRKNATQSLPSSHFSHLSCKQILCQTRQTEILSQSQVYATAPSQALESRKPYPEWKGHIHHLKWQT